MTMHHPKLHQAQAEASRGWTETRITVATALYNSGLSAARVAGLIGGVSRNAVIGKMHRGELADPQRKLPRGSTDQAKGVRQPSQRRVRTRGPVVRVNASPKERPIPPSVVDVQIPVEQRRSLFQLNDACCHWPVGDPRDADFFFCGAPKANDADVPYCASHLFRSQRRDAKPTRPHGASFVNAGPNAPWRARAR
ncbi:GcrA family cell cycle regulator [Bradyrhizobium sp. LA6.7]|uniref:GcrA family cell cycle regulator n=1 Tax=unclassified Bradyrhizobium TaxID=2631580 RepID=UPI00339A141B